MSNHQFTLEEVELAGRGHWDTIIPSVVGSSELTHAISRAGRMGPCPICPSTKGSRSTKFRVFKDFATTGKSVCNDHGCSAGPWATIKMLSGNRLDKNIIAEVARLSGLDADDKGSYVRPKLPPKPIVIPEPIKVNTKKLSQVKKLWNSGVLFTGKDSTNFIQKYLDKRGVGDVDFDRGVIRCGFQVPYWDYDLGKHAGKHPAMLSLVTDSEGRALTIHKTYLSYDGLKAKVSKPKKLASLPIEGSLSLSPSIKLAEPAETLGITEGIENALSVMKFKLHPCWSVYSGSVMPNFRPPSIVKHLIIYADFDLLGAGQTKACVTALNIMSWAKAQHRNDLKVTIRLPAKPCTEVCFYDFSDKKAEEIAQLLKENGFGPKRIFLNKMSKEELSEIKCKPAHPDWNDLLLRKIQTAS